MIQAGVQFKSNSSRFQCFCECCLKEGCFLKCYFRQDFLVISTSHSASFSIKCFLCAGLHMYVDVLVMWSCAHMLALSPSRLRFIYASLAVLSPDNHWQLRQGLKPNVRPLPLFLSHMTLLTDLTVSARPSPGSPPPPTITTTHSSFS